jgi:hypothetical protein
MSQRMDLSVVAPAGFRAMLTLEGYLRGRVDRTLLELDADDVLQDA